MISHVDDQWQIDRGKYLTSKRFATSRVNYCYLAVQGTVDSNQVPYDIRSTVEDSSIVRSFLLLEVAIRAIKVMLAILCYLRSWGF